MRVHVVSSASIVVPADDVRTPPEMVFEVARRAVRDRADIDLLVSGSSDFLDGRSFGFAYALEALGAGEPILESHLEMDGAWAAYYAWLKLLAGEATTALVVAWGKCSEAPLGRVLNAQLDPFTLAPLGLDHVATAMLQADAWTARTGRTVDGKSAQPADAACAVVLSTRAPDGAPWIAGADHRSESGALGARDLSRLPSTERAMARAREIAGWSADVAIDAVELSAPFPHQPAMLREALGVEGGATLEHDPLMVTGLIRLAECAKRVQRRGVAHASAGHALQQNLVFLLEAAR